MDRIHGLLTTALAELDRAFTERSIGWWLDGGSLLGAVRYGHLIPWDDDIDIGVTREGFDAILAIPDREWPPGLTRLHRGNDDGIPDCGPLKILLDHTAVLDDVWFQHPASRAARTGLSIDVFAFDRVPARGPRRRFVDRMRLEYFWKEMMRLGRTDPSEGGSWRNRAHLSVLRGVPSPALTVLLKVSHKVGDASPYWGYAVNLQWDFAVEQSVIWPTARRPLGSLAFPHPHKVDEYLRTMYGPDYLQEPPETQRITHALYVGLPSTP